jgi:dephospho-CoA kinase
MIVCITGGIGSGKTIVAKIFEVLGYPVYYSDERAKAMYYLPDIKQKVIDYLGDNAYTPDGQINKPYIAQKIFSDNDLLQKINTLIHTAVHKDFEEFKKKHSNAPIIFKESALIFEANIQSTCDKIILVTAPEKLKIERIKKRDNLDEQSILQRMQKQWSDDKKIVLSDYVIMNDETEPLLPKVLKILEEIKSERNSNNSKPTNSL